MYLNGFWIKFDTLEAKDRQVLSCDTLAGHDPDHLELKLDAAETAGTSKVKYTISSYSEYSWFLNVDTLFNLL
ncbi:MAG: hypothetical protein OJF50_000607 [Nitrospira sp.]|jgi:hypothetical protein|nr:hypothetical protein [Nitrospira sp.]